MGAHGCVHGMAPHHHMPGNAHGASLAPACGIPFRGEHQGMQITLIVKPHAPAIMDRLRAAAGRLRADGHHVSFHVTWKAKDIEELARRSVGGADLVVVAGGDGTLNRAVHGLMSGDGEPPPLAVIPLGTANDFARSRGIPTDVDEAMEVALCGRRRRVDVACANDRWFINVSTGGFGASATRRARRGLKRRLGAAAYLVTGARLLLRLRPERARFVVDGAVVHDGPFMFFAVANGEQTGGGTPVAPLADVRDGRLDLTVVRTRSRTRFIRLLPRLRAGTHIDDPDVLYTRGSRIEVRAPRAIDVNLDGEPMRIAEVRYSVHMRSLEIMHPQ